MKNERLFQTKEDYFKYRGKLASVAMAEKARRGELTCAAPVGYRNATVNGRKAVVIDETRLRLPIMANAKSGEWQEGSGDR